MHRVVLGLVVCLLAAPVAAQTITNVSGTLTHGSTITLTVTSPGTKPTGPPVCFDDFQSPTLNANISTGSACSWSNPASNDTNPIASNAVLRAGTPHSQHMRSRWLNGGASGNASSSVLVTSTFSKLHFDGWLYFDTSGITGGDCYENAKPWRLHSTSAGVPSWNIAFTTSMGVHPCTDAGSAYHSQMDGLDSSHCGFGSAGLGSGDNRDFHNQWRHIQWFGSTGSGNGAADGYVIFAVDGGAFDAQSQSNCLTTSAGVTSYPEFYLGNYIRGGDWSGTMSAYWDSVLIDSSTCRVEIGNNATYTSATHREPQPIITYGTTTTVRLNRGSFGASDSVYFYIGGCSSATAMSAGFATTLGGAPDTTPPVVTITGPTSSPTATVTVGSGILTTLAGTCTDNVAPTSVTWANSAGGSGSASGTTSWAVSNLVLRQGRNTVTVTCADAASNLHQDAIEITYQPSFVRQLRLRAQLAWPLFPLFGLLVMGRRLRATRDR
jgi:hypothetical protein